MSSCSKIHFSLVLRVSECPVSGVRVRAVLGLRAGRLDAAFWREKERKVSGASRGSSLSPMPLLASYITAS